MARITVEDCLDHVDNRFELVMVSSKRARQLALGSKEPLLPWENDKPTVMALREIEEGLVTASILDEKEESSDLMMESMDEEVTEGEEGATVAPEATAEPSSTEPSTEQPSSPEAE